MKGLYDMAKFDVSFSQTGLGTKIKSSCNEVFIINGIMQDASHINYSAVQNASYITGLEIYEERIGISVNFSIKRDISLYDMVVPDHAPEIFKDSKTAWNILEVYEDAQVMSYFEKQEKQITLEQYEKKFSGAIKGVLVLPIELSLEQNNDLLKNYIRTQFTDKGHFVTYAIHLDKGNPTAHLLISQRTIKDDGTFSMKKNREMLSRTGIYLLCKEWAEVTNKHLEMAGQDARIDYRH